MKKMICLQIGVLLLLAGFCVTCNRDKAQEPPGKDRIVFYSSPELFELTREWAGVYCTLNPEVDIEVVSTSGPAIAENLDQSAALSFVTSDFEPEIYDRSLWKVVVGRDIIVPVINTRNPYAEEICKQGVSPAGLARILNSTDNTLWSTLTENGPDAPVRLYATNETTLRSGIARFLEMDQVYFSEENTLDPENFIASVSDDIYSMGICCLADIIDPVNQEIFENIRLLPIDRNGNGFIDYKEDVYASLDMFARGVWIGKYPRTLSSNLYTVSTSCPVKESERAFLTWIVTRGQVLLDNHGFNDLPEFERQAQVRLIDGIGGSQPGTGGYALPKEPGFFASPLTYFLAVLLLLTILLFTILRLRNRRKAAIPVQEPIVQGLAFIEDRVQVLPGLYYDKSHTWAFLEEDGLVRVGIDDFLQRLTGPLTRIKMKSPGERIKKGKQAVSIIQDGKQLDISAPVSGTIREMNSSLVTDSSLLNSSPYANGWIYKIEPTNWIKEAQFLVMGMQYRKWLKKEFQRLKDFLANALRPEEVGYIPVLQDGGEVRENILKDLGPELWEDFQTNFMDVSS